MTRRPAFLLLRHAFLAATLLTSLPALADDFKPISKEELAMKDNPAAPGAHAMILEWVTDTNDVTSVETEYFRIKIFNEEGKKHGDIEIPYNPNSFNIGGIKARTIQPDGTVVPFTGKVFEKLLAKGRGFQYKAKTFSFPDVRPGSILEYKYRRTWDASALLSTHWDLQGKLFVRKATLTLKAYTGGFVVATYISMMPPGAKQPISKGDSYIVNLENVPAFEEEDFSLPERQIKPYIDFFYRSSDAKTPDECWSKYAKSRFSYTEDFIGKRNYIRQAVETLVAPADSNDTKLRKIYARVQQIRNLSYEETKTRQEQSRVTPKDNNNVEDVLKNGYGYRGEINRLFVGMARAAGLTASVARISQRDAQIFRRELLDDRQLDGEIAVVQADGKEIMLDPGTPFCPYGLLSWENTGVEALRLEKGVGSFFRTPHPVSTQAMTRRTSEMTMDEEGGLKGIVKQEYYGQQALRMRLEALETDAAEQKKDYEENLERVLPSGAKATLLKIGAATDGEQPLHLEFEVTIPSVTSSVGARTLLPMLVFQSRNSNPFEFAKRVRPVYFRYPFQELESVQITLPPGLKVESLPKSTVIQPPFGYYDTKWQQSGNVVSVVRRRSLDGVLFQTPHYPALRDFYSQMNSSDRETLVLRQGQ